MAEEKVGFGFEFGIKGDKEVKQSLEDILRVVASSGNALQAAGSIANVAGKLFEVGGRFGGGIAVAATAMYEFAKHSYEAGENLRRVRQDMIRLDRVPSAALSDSELAGNTEDVISHFKELGIEAGNQFTTSFATRLKNWGTGALAVNWDVQAAVANMFGAKIPSYESTSPEALDAQNRVYEDQTVEVRRINRESKTKGSLAQAELDELGGIHDVYQRQYKGALPESYLGQKRIRELHERRAETDLGTLDQQAFFDKQRYSFLTGKDFVTHAKVGNAAPFQNLPNSTIPDTAGRRQEILDLQNKINAELIQQAHSEQDILDLKKDQRQADREWAKNQNYGMWRTLGLGGVGFQDAPHARGGGLNSVSAALGGHRGRVTDGFGVPNVGTAFMSNMKAQTETLQEMNKRIGKIGIPTIQN